MNKNDWESWANYVLKELEDLNKKLDKQTEETVLLRLEIERIKIKSGLWGTMGAILVVLISQAKEMFGIK